MDTEYMKKAVGRHLSHALSEVAIRRPERPIEFLAYYLISLHEAELCRQKKESPPERRKTSKSVIENGSSTEKVVASVLSDLVEQSAEQYDPMVAESLSDADLSRLLEQEGTDVTDEMSPEMEVIGSDTFLDEKLAQLVVDDSKNPRKKLIAIPENQLASSIYDTTSRKELEQSNSNNAIEDSRVFSIPTNKRQSVGSVNAEPSNTYRVLTQTEAENLDSNLINKEEENTSN